MKFGRVYRLTIQTTPAVFNPETQTTSSAEAIVVEYPMTLIMDISRNTLASANRGHFQIYNLTPEHRKRVFHDRYDTLNYRQIVLQAGYQGESPLPVIFNGNINAASSYRSGTNWITEIEAYDGGFGIMNGQVSQTVPAGWNLPQIIKSTVQSMPNVVLGAIGAFTEQNARGVTIMGNSWEVLGRIAAGQNANAFIDNQQVNLIKKNEYISKAGSISLITSDTGLLGTPRRYDARIDIEILFEPRLVIGQLIELQSLEKLYNAQYQVIGITHRGTISGAVCDKVTTTASLWRGTSLLNPVARVF